MGPGNEWRIDPHLQPPDITDRCVFHDDIMDSAIGTGRSGAGYTEVWKGAAVVQAGVHQATGDIVVLKDRERTGNMHRTIGLRTAALYCHMIGAVYGRIPCVRRGIELDGETIGNAAVSDAAIADAAHRYAGADRPVGGVGCTGILNNKRQSITGIATGGIVDLKLKPAGEAGVYRLLELEPCSRRLRFGIG